MKLPSLKEQLQEYYSPEECAKYLEYFQYFDQNHYIVIPYESPVPRLPIQVSDDDPVTIADNNKFPLLFFIPDSSPDMKIEHLVIMINGFNELKPLVKLYSDSRWGLSTLLGQRNRRASSVLLPIPFHYWRKPVASEYYSSHPPSYFVYDYPIRFYLGYRQIMYDLEALCKSISESKFVLSDRFSDSVKMHLFGFSLGGLGALAALIKDWLDETNYFSSCTLINSGGTLDTFSFALTGYSDSQVAELKGFYYSKTLEDVVTKELGENIRGADDRLYRIFENRVLGPKTSKRWRSLDASSCKKALKHSSSKILFLMGDEDEILDYEEVLKSFPITIGKKKQVYLKDLSHLPARNLSWKNEGLADTAIGEMWHHILECSKP